MPVRSIVQTITPKDYTTNRHELTVYNPTLLTKYLAAFLEWSCCRRCRKKQQIYSIFVSKCSARSN